MERFVFREVPMFPNETCGGLSECPRDATCGGWVEHSLPITCMHWSFYSTKDFSKPYITDLKELQKCPTEWESRLWALVAFVLGIVVGILLSVGFVLAARAIRRRMRASNPQTITRTDSHTTRVPNTEMANGKDVGVI